MDTLGRIKITFSVVFVHIGNFAVSAVSTKSRFATTTKWPFPQIISNQPATRPFLWCPGIWVACKTRDVQRFVPGMVTEATFLPEMWTCWGSCQVIVSRAHLFYTPLAQISFEDLNALDRSQRRGHIWRGREDLQRWSTPSIDRQTLQPWGTRGDTLACRSKEIKFGWWKNQSCQDWMLSSSTDLCALPGSILSSYPSLSHE